MARERFAIRINRGTGNYAVLTTRLTYEPSRFRKHVYEGVAAAAVTTASCFANFMDSRVANCTCHEAS